MKLLKFCLFAMLCAVVGHASASAAEPYDIHVVLSRTGAGALLGEGQIKALEILKNMVNGEGGIDGHPLNFIVHDDQSSPQIAVQATSEILATHPAFILGAGLTATCSAMVPMVRKGPVMYCLSPGISPERGSYAFSATIPHDGFLQAVVKYFHDRGFKRIALIMSTDSTGHDGERAADRAIGLPEMAGMQVVERVHFNPGDVSLSAQIARVADAHPQAIIAWSTGTAMGTVLRGLKQGNVDVPLATSTGNLLYSFMDRFADLLPSELVFAGGPGMLDDPRLHLDPRVVARIKQRVALFKAAGVVLDDAAETVWDPVLMAVEALRKFGPNASATQIRDYLMGLDSWPGVYGVYDFHRVPQRGLDASNAVITRWDAARHRFEAVSQPGGGPIAGATSR